MARLCFILALLVAACATPERPTPYYIPYDGYGASPTHRGFARGEVIGRDDGRYAASLSVADIGPALDRFMSPEGDRLILLPNRLDRSQLDFSVESLKTIDDWLKDVHTVNRLQASEGRAGESLIADGRGDNTVSFAGLYLGEVIRANSQLDWRWERFDRFMAANPYFTEHYGFDPGLDSFVLVGPQGVATPINTALKRILNGKEESLHYIGTLLLDPIDLDAAVSGHDFYGLTDIR
jgi:hypothetical protein|tara:strand:+ start:144 stop:854 length:711 start_codon:yes stop_codon:yes gene_type:complete